ncbi:MAG: hypothetical protein EBT63_05250 [Proteobacteria bacterium]|nr:hypothetical protein [Pseudomonadota bacterium]
MNDNFLKTLTILLCVFMLSCANKKRPYLISNFSDINSLEEVDHQTCVKLKLNFDKNNNIDSKLYWHCRLSFSKFHLEVYPVLPRQIEFNQKISDLVTQISLIISKNQENNIVKEVNKLEEIDHKKCLKLGYDNQSKEQIKVEEYYQCRKNLIELNFAEPPFSNNQYQKYHNKSYDIAFVIDKRIKKSFDENQKKIAENPECTSFKPSSDDFKKCSDSVMNFQKCLNDSNKKITETEAKEKIICQKQAYLRFNDEMIKEEDRVDNKIKNRNLNSDRDNRNNFESFGINENDFLGKAEKEKVAQENIKKISKIDNSTRGIYSKQEISWLRKKFIVSCMTTINSKNEIDKKNFIKDCEKLKYTKINN